MFDGIKQKTIKLFSKTSLLLAILFGAAGFFVCLYFYIGYGAESNFKQLRVNRNNPGKYQFINPLLSCEAADKRDISEFRPLKARLSDLISNKIFTKQVGAISVYFDTRDGRWLGINTSERYYPASLLKVPTMIALFKEAEANLDILSKELAYDGKTNLSFEAQYPPTVELKSGSIYTMEELMARSIMYSDNNAQWLVMGALTDPDSLEIFSDLGIQPPTEDKLGIDFMSVKDFAYFFRILYNASYLNVDYSEKALRLLTKSDFKNGLRAGVPDNIPVAAKFGEINIVKENSSGKELHDCGIIYYPRRNYLLCVMTKGGEYEQMANSIKDISRLTYDYIDQIGKD